jgi:hypothetical protein
MGVLLFTKSKIENVEDFKKKLKPFGFIFWERDGRSRDSNRWESFCLPNQK